MTTNMPIDDLIMPDFSDKIVVVGLGLTGLSVVRYLVAKGCVPIIVDSREKAPGYETLQLQFPEVETCFGLFDKDKLALAKQLIVSPGISIQSAEIAYASSQGVEVIGDIELFARNVDAPVIAITGSNGKSTVTTLVGDIFNECGWKVGVGGNIGVPALDLLNQQCQLYVLELSSFQLETTSSLKPAAAVVLNICEDHLDRYASYEDYIAVKKTIYDQATLCVINRDDVIVNKMLAVDKTIGFSLTQTAANDYSLKEVDGSNWIYRNDQAILNADQLFIAGLHNVANVMAALALASEFDLDEKKVVTAIQEFPGLPHRMQCVAISNNVKWIDDSKATNVGATEAAINGLVNNIVLIAGGESKDADLTALQQPVKRAVKAMVLIGRDADKIASTCEGLTEIYRASCMYDAVVKAKEISIAGDYVLLSPACASFDMFDNYMHRGDVFTDAVKAVLA